MEGSPQKISRLLIAWSDGEQAAVDELVPLVYEELRHIARRYTHGRNQTLQTTALVHETFLRLAVTEGKQWQNRAHFFGVAAQAMRHILVDYARARCAIKRGGEVHSASLAPDPASHERAASIVALDDALSALTGIAPRQSRVVELRYFGGLSVNETAQVLGVSPETVTRDWRMAKSWLLRELTEQQSRAELQG
jgi:RNA polymerase sigma factor (TIGR02999 family)